MHCFKGRLLQRRMDRYGGNVRKTAESLSVLPTNLYRRLREHGISYSDQEGVDG